MAYTLSRNSSGGMKTKVAPNARGASPMTRAVASGLAVLRGVWVRHRDAGHLQALSDYQLRDIGIRRGQIDDVVRTGRY